MNTKYAFHHPFVPHAFQLPPRFMCGSTKLYFDQNIIGAFHECIRPNSHTHTHQTHKYAERFIALINNSPGRICIRHPHQIPTYASHTRVVAHESASNDVIHTISLLRWDEEKRFNWTTSNARIIRINLQVSGAGAQCPAFHANHWFVVRVHRCEWNEKLSIITVECTIPRS